MTHEYAFFVHSSEFCLSVMVLQLEAIVFLALNLGFSDKKI